MIIVNLNGGLGNQMFQYALGRRLALDRGVPLKLDISWFQKQNLRSYQLGDLQIVADIASRDEITNLTRSNLDGLKGRFFQGVQRRLPYYHRRIVKEKASSFDDNIIRKVSRNVYLIGFWQSEKYFAPISGIIRKELRSQYELSSQGKFWADKINSSSSISVHIRRGDYANDLNIIQKHGTCSIEYYKDAVKRLIQYFPDGKFFVFSDDLVWARQNLLFLPICEFVELDGIRRDVEELMLMSLCKHHIVANSSYSWWGAWFDANPNKIVIAPWFWFKDPNIDTQDLLPDEWIRL